MECSYFDSIRLQYSELFPSNFEHTPIHMRAILNHDSQNRVAECLFKIEQLCIEH